MLYASNHGILAGVRVEGAGDQGGGEGCMRLYRGMETKGITPQGGFRKLVWGGGTWDSRPSHQGRREDRLGKQDMGQRVP